MCTLNLDIYGCRHHTSTSILSTASTSMIIQSIASTSIQSMLVQLPEPSSVIIGDTSSSSSSSSMEIPDEDKLGTKIIMHFSIQQLLTFYLHLATRIDSSEVRLSFVEHQIKQQSKSYCWLYHIRWATTKSRIRISHLHTWIWLLYPTLRLQPST